MSDFLKTVLTFVNVLILGGMLSCGREETSQLYSDAQNVPWTLWCQQAKLTDCAPYAGGISQQVWESSLNIAKTLVNSPSKIQFQRADIERPAVQRLFQVSGAEDILQIVAQIPWQNIGIGGGFVGMDNLGAKGKISINSLTLVTTGKSQFAWKLPYVIDVAGVILSTPSGEQLNLLKIDFSKAGQLSFVTNTKTISNIPMDFFALRKHSNTDSSAVDSVIRAISDVIFEPGFNWRNAVNIALDSSNISVIRQALHRPDAGVVLKLVDSALANSKSFLIGGTFRKEVLSLELNSAVDCSMKFTNVPVLGNVTANLSFAKRFGLATMARQEAKVISQVYGINTTLGNLENVTLDGSKIVLKLGVISIPLDLSSKDTSGPQVSEINCVNRI
ncbi:MAG: hypothetical protein WCI18_02165 [Pseudomonadota bacterium]